MSKLSRSKARHVKTREVRFMFFLSAPSPPSAASSRPAPPVVRGATTPSTTRARSTWRRPSKRAAPRQRLGGCRNGDRLRRGSFGPAG